MKNWNIFVSSNFRDMGKVMLVVSEREKFRSGMKKGQLAFSER